MRVLLTGASGQLGAYVLERLVESGHVVTCWSGTDAGNRCGIPLIPVDLCDFAALDRAVEAADPEAIIHAAAMSHTEAVRRDPARGRTINADATAKLAKWCARHGRRIVYTSTDLVFDGSRSWYRETDPAQPVLEYGRTKLAGEPSVVAAPRGLVARVSLMFGPSRSGRESYFDKTIAALRRGEPQTLFQDEFRTALDLRTAADALVRLMESEATGLLHVAGRERVSRFELIQRIATSLGIDGSLVRANRQADVQFAEPRPADVSLDTSRLATVLPQLVRPSIEEAVAAMAL